MERFYPDFVRDFDESLRQIKKYNSAIIREHKQSAYVPRKPTVQRGIMEYLIKNGGQVLRNIHVNVDAPYATVSYNLRILQKKGYIVQEKHRAPYYSRVDSF
jgi:predicted transcriptional regulator